MSVRSPAVLFAPPAWVAITAVATGVGRDFDAAAIEGFRSLPGSWRHDVQVGLETVDAWAVPAAGGVLLVAALLMGRSLTTDRSPMRGTGRLALFLTVGGLVAAAAKRLLPDVPATDEALVGNSLPSGHVYVATAALALVACGVGLRRPDRRDLAVAIACGCAASFAAAVLVSVGHRTSDVIVSLLIVESIVAACSDFRVSRGAVALSTTWVVLIVVFAALPSGPTGDAPIAAMLASVVFVIMGSVALGNSLRRFCIGGVQPRPAMVFQEHWAVPSGSS